MMTLAHLFTVFPELAKSRRVWKEQAGAGEKKQNGKLIYVILGILVGVTLLCLILPQGFLTAGSAPQIDALGALLLVAALTLLDEKHPLGGMLLYGAAFALSGAALYALPLVALLGRRSGAKGRHAALAALVALAACLPDARRAACSPRISPCRSMRRAFRT